MNIYIYTPMWTHVLDLEIHSKVDMCIYIYVYICVYR